MRLALLAVSALFTLMSPAVAQERVTLGWGRMFANDALGDGKDRWRTGAYAVSVVRGINWTGSLPTTPGEMLEFRLRADTLTPANLENPETTDRRYAGAITIGVHTQFDLGGYEADLGGDLVIVGPQTGIGDFQSWVHGAFGEGDIAALDTQIDDAVLPTVSAEIARRFSFGERVEVRPYVEGRAGDETLVRAGADLVFGSFGSGALMLRDVGTGQRFRGVEGTRTPGVSVVMGGDIARVFESIYLPDDEAVTPSETRHRLRAGLQWQGEKSSAFYGVTYLSPEFEEQDEGQFVGALTLNFRF